MMTPQRSIGLFSGTFDPIHNGHLALAQAALKQLGLDEVWILVDANPPNKTGVTAFRHRLAMAALAVADRPQLIADREPVQKHPQHYSVATARRLVRDYPQCRFTLIMGMDTFITLDRWERYTELITLMAFGVARRRELDERAAEALTQRLGAAAKDLQCTLLSLLPAPESSTQIQRAVRRGEAVGDVPPKVYEYIKQHRLYRPR